MKRLFFLIILTVILVTSPSVTFAQGMMTQSVISPVDHTAQEEAEGKEILEKLQAKQLECQKFTDDDFGALGEYFMGQSIGNTQRHAAMNQMMTNMMGEKGEEQMHIILGKRSSGCDTNAKFPSGYGFMPMMGMMRGGGNPMMSYGWNNMMGWGGFGLSWVFMILFWALIILGVVALIRYLGGQHNADKGKTPLDILKERYARGEIDKKEFEEMKKELK